MPDESLTDPESIAAAARARLPDLVSQIVGLIARTDPVELLAHLTLLFQTHPETTVPNRDEMARWQVRIEWLTWLICTRKMVPPVLPAVLDGAILTPLEELLDDYFDSVAMTLLEATEGLPPLHSQLRASLRTSALFVRGEGFQHQFQQLAVELYSPHDEWCRGHIGLTISEALTLAAAFGERFSTTLHETRRRSYEIMDSVRRKPAMALEIRLPWAVQASLAEALPRPGSEDAFATAIGSMWLFLQAPAVVGCAKQELVELVAGSLDATHVDAFLGLLSFNPDEVVGEPDPFALSPLAKRPLLHDQARDRYLLLAPGTLLEGLFYAFHAKLFGDTLYRPRYDESRAAIIEAAAVDAFRRLLPRAQSGWRLKYGPRKQRKELDGLLWHDGKLILIECKWKNLQLVSRAGHVDGVLADVDKAILQPLAQAKRARDYIKDVGDAEFEEEGSGRRIQIRSAEVSEVFLVTIVGSGAWAQIAANLPRLAPLGLFRDGEYPWALSISDLRVVSECLEGLPPLLFDYLRRRARFQSDERFRLYDEWDFLGVYTAGALDVDDPNFPKDADLISLDGFDSGLQDYYGTLGANRAANASRPKRRIPDGLWRLLVDAEKASSSGAVDAICLILGLSDAELSELDAALAKLAKKTLGDGRAHAVATRPPSRPVGIALACGYQDQLALQTLLSRAIQAHQLDKGVEEWVGLGLDLASPSTPILRSGPGST